MITQSEMALSELYEADETAWLEAMAQLIQRGAVADLDYAHLAEYLSAMAKRDRREVKSRLTMLLAHVLKWVYQSDRRSRSWQLTIIEQRDELEDLLGQGVLRRHAKSVLKDAYSRAVERAMTETDLPAKTFPAKCPFTIEQLLAFAPAGKQ